MNHLLAYVDPGTGSFAIQFLIAGLVSGMYMVSSRVAAVKALFKKKNSIKMSGADQAQ